MQSALHQAFGAAEAQSDQHSDDSAAMYTSSTGYSHSPPISPRGKRPCNIKTVTSLHTSPLPSHGGQEDGNAESGRKHEVLAGTPVGADTPDHQREVAARGKGEEDVRQRAACELYGLRRLRASPRWALEAAQMSDDSRSAGITITAVAVAVDL